nr:MAG TPA: hypothetical protein [Bacteriophage sp.]
MIWMQQSICCNSVGKQNWQRLLLAGYGSVEI